MLAILRDQDLEQYIEKDARYPIAVKPSELTEAEEAKQKQWRNRDVKAGTRIELAIRDAEMIHISGATSAKEMWEQLTSTLPSPTHSEQIQAEW